MNKKIQKAISRVLLCALCLTPVMTQLTVNAEETPGSANVSTENAGENQKDVVENAQAGEEVKNQQENEIEENKTVIEGPDGIELIILSQDTEKVVIEGKIRNTSGEDNNVSLYFYDNNKELTANIGEWYSILDKPITDLNIIGDHEKTIAITGCDKEVEFEVKDNEFNFIAANNTDGSFKLTLENTQNRDITIIPVMGATDEEMPYAPIYVGKTPIEEDKDKGETLITEKEVDPYIENYIRANINKDYTELTQLKLADFMEISNLAVDGALITADDTIDSVMLDIEHLEKVYTSVRGFATVYDPDPDGQYYVALIDTMKDANSTYVQDVIFAKTGNDGIVVDNCIYDYDTGIAYLDKSEYEGENGHAVGALQAQLMQVLSINFQNPMAAENTECMTYATVMSEVDNNEVTEKPVQKAILDFSLETTVTVEKYLKDMTVYVNGVPLKEGNFRYNPQTGELTVPYSSLTITSVYVESSAANEVEKFNMSQETFAEDRPISGPNEMWSWGTVKWKDKSTLGWPGWGYSWWYGDYYADQNDASDGAYGEMFQSSTAITDMYTMCQQIYWGAEGDCAQMDAYNLVAMHHQLYWWLNLMVTDPSQPYEVVNFENWVKNGTGGVSLQCCHESVADSNGEIYSEGSWRRSIWRVMNWNPEADGYVILGILTPKQYTQCGAGFIRFNLQPEPKTGTAKVKKVSTENECTFGNEGYSLKGAEYGIYKNKSDASKEKNAVAKLVTDANGDSNEVELDAGTYYVKETLSKVPRGFYPDETIYTAKIEPEKTTTVTSKEIPKMDPIGVLLRKYDADSGKYEPAGNGSLEGAEYTIRYYKEILNSDAINPADVGKKAIRTWVFKTDSKGSIRFRESQRIKTSDPLWRDINNDPAIPIGTITIEETKAPKGYHKNETLYIRQFTIENIEKHLDQSVETYNIPEQPERSIQANIVKKIEGTNRFIPGVTFTHVKPDGTKETAVTDAQGKVSFKGLETGTHAIMETSAPEDFIVNNSKVVFTVKSDGTMVKDNKTVIDDLVSFEIKNNDAYVTVNDKPVPFELNITKSNEHGNKLKNAEFTIYSDDSCKKEVSSAVSDENGKVVFKGLNLNKKYFMQETKAPEGYRIPREADGSIKVFTIELRNDFNGNVALYIDDVKTSNEIKYVENQKIITKCDVINDTLIKLPSTGTVGTLMIFIIGSMLMIASFKILDLKRK